MKDYIEDTFDDIEADIYAVLGRINAIRMDIHGGHSIPDVKREWQPLTDKQITEECYGSDEMNGFVEGARWANEKLKELNND